MHKATRNDAIEVVEQAIDHLPLRLLYKKFQGFMAMNPFSDAARVKREQPKKSKRISFWLDRRRNKNAAACFYRYVAEVQKSTQILDFFYAAIDFLVIMAVSHTDELLDSLQWRTLFAGSFFPFVVDAPDGHTLPNVFGSPDHGQKFGALFADCVAHVL